MLYAISYLLLFCKISVWLFLCVKIICKMHNITESEYYNRQLILDNFGPDKQNKLRNSKVVIIGAGGLGCPALQYLVGAGVGNITIIDGDKIKAHNLHRQILFNINDIGLFKAEVAAEKLSKLNPFVKIQVVNNFINTDNIDIFLNKCDVVIDATDNFNARFQIGDYTAQKAKPLVYAAIYAFEGQLAVFNYNNGPSLRCLFPKIYDSETIPNCATNGVIGFVPGIMGILQATEAIKIITGIGSVFNGKLQQINLLTLKIKEFTIPNNSQNTNTEFIEINCNTLTKNLTEIMEITSKELFKLLKFKPDNIFIVDVREPHEWEEFNIGGTLIPMNEIELRLIEIPNDKDIVVLCSKGFRSNKVANILVNTHGFKNVFNLKGGLTAWVNEVGI